MIESHLCEMQSSVRGHKMKHCGAYLALPLCCPATALVSYKPTGLVGGDTNDRQGWQGLCRDRANTAASQSPSESERPLLTGKPTANLSSPLAHHLARPGWPPP